MKTFLIILLIISNIAFAWLAIRNSEPLQCTDLIDLGGNNICIVNLKKLAPSDLKKVMQQIKDEQYKYINQ